MAQILDGKIVRDKIAQDLSKQISGFDQKPKLVIFQVGDVAESNTYITQKVKFGQRIGAIVEHKKLPQDIHQRELITQIQLENKDSSTNGIIVQLPIPQNLDKDEIIEAIDPKKDVDGQTSTNIKLLFENQQEGYTPATTKGILSLLEYYKISPEAKHVVLIGRSSLVGKPTALAFLNKDATVTICHKKTKNLASITKTADILVVAAGKAKLITTEHVSKGQIIIDVGINVLTGVTPVKLTGVTPVTPVKPVDESPTRKLVGDVDFESVSKIVAAISPVPGGTGPMTVASLFENLTKAYKHQT